MAQIVRVMTQILERMSTRLAQRIRSSKLNLVEPQRSAKRSYPVLGKSKNIHRAAKKRARQALADKTAAIERKLTAAARLRSGKKIWPVLQKSFNPVVP